MNRLLKALKKIIHRIQIILKWVKRYRQLKKALKGRSRTIDKDLTKGNRGIFKGGIMKPGGRK